MTSLFSSRAGRIGLPLLVCAIVALYAVLTVDSRFSAPRWIYAVGVSYFRMPGDQTLLNGFGPASVWLFTLLYLIAATALGRLLLTGPARAAFDLRDAPYLCVSLDILAGYLISIALNRLITLALPNQYAAPLIVAIHAAALLFLLWQARATTKAVAMRAMLRVGLPLSALYGLFAILAIQYKKAHVAGDGGRFFFRLIDDGAAFAASVHFPIISQHYDEILFLYPVLALGRELPDFNLLWPYLLLYALIKCAAFIGLTWLIWRLSQSRLFAGVLAYWLFFGNLSLDPSHVLLLFDSGNPIFAILHPGRVYSVLLPGLMIYAVFAAQSRKLDVTPALLLGVALAALGFASTVVSNALIFGMLGASLGIISIAERLQPQPATPVAPINPPLTLLTALTLATTPLLVANNQFHLRFVAGGVLLTTLGMLLWSVLRYRAPNEPPTEQSALDRLLLLAGVALFAYLLGQLLLGNAGVALLWHDHVFNAQILARVLPFPPLQPTSLLDNIGPNHFCNIFPTEHCGYTGQYVQHYGLPFLLGFLGLVLLARRNGTTVATPLQQMMLLALLLFVGGVLLYEYTNGAVLQENQKLAVWLKSRLAEPGFYLVIITVGSAWVRCGGLWRIAMGGALAAAIVWDAAANVGAMPTDQLLLNARFVWGLIAGGG
ncbi:hypothetical protein [Magnetofaba australis]|uniref:Uncharacterized protein n=1 Tax=Magnetofaba australis IT-1 TaxID=1434232 RepID=A0A1Y2K4T7_9PROT|nr:hypothetical protein [Magnetofaba australis]OSM04014.1 hypothetical protein MAIT1_03734 [Magnetofaba australis IT-1]